MSDEQWPTWLVDYGYDGDRWSMEIVAPTAEDAKRRLEAAAAFGAVKGELKMRIPVGPGRMLAPLVCWFMNRPAKKGG